MKKRLCLLALLLAALSGCGKYNEYLSVQPHNNVQIESSGVVVENYDQMREALTQQISEHAQSIFLTTYSYDGDVEQDLERVVDYLRNTYPLGVYAIDSLDAQSNQVASYYQISLDVRYRHTLAEMNRIEQIRMGELEKTVSTALDRFDAQQVLYVSGWQETDLPALCEQYAAQHPGKMMEAPSVEAAFYPQSGSVRIIELTYTYTHSQQELLSMRQEVDQVLAAANSYARYGPSQGEKAQLLYSFLSDRFTYTVEQTDTPAYSMLCQGVADSWIYANIFCVLCQNLEIPCEVIEGLYLGQPHCWLLCTLDEQAYYLDPFSAELAGYPQMPLLLPEQMGDYSWEQTTPEEETPPEAE